MFWWSDQSLAINYPSSDQKLEWWPLMTSSWPLATRMNCSVLCGREPRQLAAVSEVTASVIYYFYKKILSWAVMLMAGKWWEIVLLSSLLWLVAERSPFTFSCFYTLQEHLYCLWWCIIGRMGEPKTMPQIISAHKYSYKIVYFRLMQYPSSFPKSA